METDWYNFQEKIKNIFINFGCFAETNVTINGVRTSHDIDIIVKSKFLGQNITWILEAKYWKRKISKLHVLALRQIIDDIGVDKGFIISQSGFQKGAIEAAKNSNIELLTFEELEKFSQEVFHRDILKETYLRRINYILNRYYSHSKKNRIKYSLRQEPTVFTGKFDVYFIIFTAVSTLKQAINNEYPIPLNTLLSEQYGSNIAENFYQYINWLNINLIIVEEKILLAETEMKTNNDFSPDVEFVDIENNVHMKFFKT